MAHRRVEHDPARHATAWWAVAAWSSILVLLLAGLAGGLGL